MDFLKMMKEAAAMKSKLGEMDRLLREKIIDVEVRGVSVRINAKADVLGLKIAPDVLQRDLPKIEKDVLSAVQEAMKKSHEIMAEEAKKITGGLNIPGLM